MQDVKNLCICLQLYSNPMSDRAQKSYWFLGNREHGIENR